MPSAAAAPATPASDPAAGLFDSKATVPDFSKLKKAALIAYYTEWLGDQGDADELLSTELFAKLTVKKMRERLGHLFPDPESLDSPEVTGFDPNDVIHATVAAVQAVKDEAALIDAVRELQDAAEYNFFVIGGYLAEAQSKSWTGEYDDYWTFVEATFGYKIRKAQILIQIYHALVSCGATWAEAKKIGWGKLMLIASKLEPDNYKEWFEKAEGATWASLQEALKVQKNEGNEPDPSTLPSEPIKKLSFSIHEDQLETIKDALQKAKEDGNTEYDGPALEYICADFLSAAVNMKPGIVAPQPASGADVTLHSVIDPFAQEEEGFLSVLEVFTEVFPEVDIDVWPDGKPTLEGYLTSLVEEHGAQEVFEALKQNSEE